MDIKWERSGPGEEKATYKNMRLRKKAVAGKTAYFVYRGDDQTPEFTTSYYQQFMKKVQSLSDLYDHKLSTADYFKVHKRA